jgi:hypothetical protein
VPQAADKVVQTVLNIGVVTSVVLAIAVHVLTAAILIFLVLTAMQK